MLKKGLSIDSLASAAQIVVEYNRLIMVVVAVMILRKSVYPISIEVSSKALVR